MNLEISFQNYLDQLSSSSPTPGGGNVAALCGVLASSLGIMVCNLTIGKKKYIDFEPDANEIREKLIVLKNEFVELAEKDNEAFDKVMGAFKLPKDTLEQQEIRQEKIQAATLDASIIPANVLRKCKETITLIKVICERGNQNSLSDAGVASSLVSTAAEGAFLNVLINCSSLTNQIKAKEFIKGNEILYKEVKEISEFIITSIIKRLAKE